MVWREVPNLQFATPSITTAGIAGCLSDDFDGAICFFIGCLPVLCIYVLDGCETMTSRLGESWRILS